MGGLLVLVDKKLLRNVDWVLVATILLLIGFGMIVIYSATNRTIGPLIGSPSTMSGANW